MAATWADIYRPAFSFAFRSGPVRKGRRPSVRAGRPRRARGCTISRRRCNRMAATQTTSSSRGFTNGTLFEPNGQAAKLLTFSIVQSQLTNVMWRARHFNMACILSFSSHHCFQTSFRRHPKVRIRDQQLVCSKGAFGSCVQCKSNS